MKKSELKNIIKEVISEDIFLQNRKSPEEKAKMRELEIELEYKQKFGVEVYKGNIKLTNESLPYFKKYSKIKKVNGTFNCNSLNLTSLTDLPIPEYVNGEFNCSFNKLTSLQGAPKYVGKEFWCSYNYLTSLEGSPEYVGSIFWCHNNKLTSLQGAPKEVGGVFYCINNPTTFTKEDVRKVCDVKGEIFC